MSKRLYEGDETQRHRAAVSAYRVRFPERAKQKNLETKSRQKATMTDADWRLLNERRMVRHAERPISDPEYKTRLRAYNKSYAESHRDRAKVSAKRGRDKLRREIFEAYGGFRCNCCGDTHHEFLTIDHIHGRGREHKRELKVVGTRLYYWLRNNNFPRGFQVLCFNCNAAKHFYKICPHQARRETIVSLPADLAALS